MRYRTAVAAACLALSGLVTTASPSDAQGPSTLRAIGEYRLTMPTLRKLIAAGKAASSGPDATAINAAMGRPAMSIEDLIGVIDRYSALKQAVSASGVVSGVGSGSATVTVTSEGRAGARR